MDGSPKGSNSLIKRLLAYTGEEGIPYIDRYNKAWVLNAIDELNVIKSLDTQFRVYDSQGLGLDVVDFIKALLSIITHEQDEVLYLTIGIVDLHRDICETFGLKDRIKASDVVNYTIENFVNKEWKTHVIPTKKLPEKKKFGDNLNQIREIDINAPIVYGNSSGGIMRLINSKMVTDSQRHNNDTLNRVYFSAEVKKLFTLDSASGFISMYNINGGLEKKIAPKVSDDAEEIIILDFAWSHKQQRIGASLKDFTLIFWDFSDKFEFEMIVPIRKWVSEYQTNIWYLDFMNLWVTTDKSQKLNVWNIDKEVKHFSLTSPRIKGSIIDVIAIDLLKLVAVSTMEKIITLWDFRKRSMVLEMDLTMTSVHTMVWSNTYQVLITAGYESKINLWAINPLYLDYSLIGKLEGHNSTITAIAIIEGTSMLVSVDDQWKIKTWDLRNLKCVQTLDMEAKVFVTKIIDMYAYNKLCFISSRINFLEFDRVSMEVPNKGQQGDGDSIWPINVEYNFLSNELMVGTRKDIRFIDLGSGRTKKLYEGLLNNEEDDITAFRLIHQDKKFILGDQRGRLGLYSYATGEKLKSLVSQTEEINGLKVDVVNKMVMTSSWDNTIHIQKESNLGYELKRTVKNIHYNRETSILEISVFHNLFVTATNSNILYVWDYEFMKVMGMIELEEEAEPTCVSFINGDSSLILADSSGKIHLIKFKRKEFSRVYFERKGVIRIPNPTMDNELFVNRILIDIDCGTGQQFGDNVNKVRMYAATNKGEVKIFDLSDFVQEDLSQAIALAGPKGNYKSDRIVNEDFITQVKTYRIYTYSVKDGKNGIVLTESETQSAGTEELLMDNCIIGEFQAHKDSLTTLIAMVSPSRKILTSSLDGFVKIWTVEGRILASLNINHPLPIMWEIKNDDSVKNQTKVVNALKMIDMIVQQSKVKSSESEKKKFSIEKFLKKFVQAEEESDFEFPDIDKKPVTANKKKPVIIERKEKVLLMKDEYSPRDFQFSKAKEVFKRELQGPTLRQLDVAQKLSAVVQRGIADRPLNKVDPFEEEDHAYSFRREREKEYENSKKIKAPEMPLSKKTKLLEKKLEKISHSPHRKKSIKKASIRKSIEIIGSKKYHSKVLDEVLYTAGKQVTSEHQETTEHYDLLGKRTMSIQINDIRDSKVKLGPIKLPVRDGTLSLTASQRDLNPSGKVSFRESDASRKLGKDDYPSKSARMIEEKVKKQDFNAVISKLDAILKKPYSPSMLLKDFGKRVGSMSTRALNMPNKGRSSTHTMMDIEAKSPKSPKKDLLGIKQGDRIVSFDRFKSKKSTAKYPVDVQSPKKKKTSEVSSPKNAELGTKTIVNKHLKDVTMGDNIMSLNNSGQDFETLENTFAGMNQFLGKMGTSMKKPYFADLKVESPKMKGNKPILIMQRSKKGDTSPKAFE